MGGPGQLWPEPATHAALIKSKASLQSILPTNCVPLCPGQYLPCWVRGCAWRWRDQGPPWGQLLLILLTHSQTDCWHALEHGQGVLWPKPSNYKQARKTMSMGPAQSQTVTLEVMALGLQAGVAWLVQTPHRECASPPWMRKTNTHILFCAKSSLVPMTDKSVKQRRHYLRGPKYTAFTKSPATFGRASTFLQRRRKIQP